MNFEALQKAWQAQDANARATIDTDALLKKVRRDKNQFWRIIFWRDVREVGAAFLGTWYFFNRGLRNHDWTDCLMALACFGVGVFMLVDRRLQSRKKPVASDSLLAGIESSLQEVNHQIWLLKNVSWSYLLPLFATWLISVAVTSWQERHTTSKLIGWGVYVAFGILMYWYIYRLNQNAVKKSLRPRKHELEALLAQTGQPVHPPETNNKTVKTTIVLSILAVAALAVGVILAVHQPEMFNQTMKTPILLSIVVVAVLAAGVVLIAVPSTTAAAPNQPLEDILKDNNLPALAVVVVKDGKICDREAVGVRKWGDPTPVTTNDVFHIGSCTKSMTATLVAILIEEGKLRWDTTIAEVFPELKGKMDKQYEAVTVEQLLQHRGGVPGGPPAAAWKRAWEEHGTPTQQRREFIEVVLAQPPAAAPGTKMIYSNQGYAIAGAMLEKITGQDYETLITEKLFKPLHMDTAGFGPPGTKDEVDQPWGHIRKLTKMIPVQSDNPPAITPAGRVHCSLDDLARFVMLHLQSTTNGLLKPETLARLHAPAAGATAGGQSYACGWVVLQRDWAGGTTLMHNGSNTMWYVVMWLAPGKDFAVIAATNIAGSGAEAGCDEAATLMIQKWLPQ